ncbi:hypothetical protein GCM10027289_07910 [Tsukamurella serpentis]
MNPNPPSNPQHPAQQFPAPHPAAPYSGAPGSDAPQHPGGVPGAPGKPRPGWLIPALIGAAAVAMVIVLIVGVVLVRSLGGGSGGSPGGAVKAYFEALQAGDAKKALSFGRQAPAGTDLLTDEVLRKQRDLAPIKDLKIVSESGDSTSTVHLTVTIGDVAYDEKLNLTKVDGDWKLDTAAVQLKPSATYESDRRLLTVLGKPLPASGVVYVFPGALDLGSADKNLAPQKTRTPSGFAGQAPVKGLTRFGAVGGFSIGFGLSESAKTEARQQIGAQYAACAASRDRAPSRCPQADFSGENGSYTWTAPGVDQIDLNGRVRDGKLLYRDDRPWAFTATARDGRPITGTDSVFVFGNVTVTADSVSVSLR